MQVSDLTEEERRFVLLTIINGDVSNKILASEVIRKHIVGDEKLLEMVNNYISPSTMPEVVAFFIRSVIVDGIDKDKETELVRMIVACDIYTRFYHMEFSLSKGDEIEAEDYLELVSELSYTLNDEAIRVLLKYFAKNEKVKMKALSSVNVKFRKRESISRDLAWKYLLTCWLNDPNVVKAIAEELKESHPFCIGNGYEQWQIIQRQKLSPELLQVITEWKFHCC